MSESTDIPEKGKILSLVMKEKTPPLTFTMSTNENKHAMIALNDHCFEDVLDLLVAAGASVSILTPVSNQDCNSPIANDNNSLE